ncbi:uncharacterized protein LOC122014239 isoform X1 [Zingiber officinale]|uniref:uncharacterized protein LOC122014239 isoform X1 n=1 Tax=Zingiber officinale TaxID=94328 RepID=UPI001C4D85C2|nr:uncharacterized protein LOC122014239 isoform X1 [Zingiber officinale]
MACSPAHDVESSAVLEIKEANGDYVRLDNGDPVRLAAELSYCGGRIWSSLCWWVKAVLLGAFLLAVAVLLIVFGGPWMVKKVVIPVLEWAMTSFTKPVLGLLLFASIAIFPTLLLPSSPSMWIVGMTFGYGYGFLLILTGMSIGMSLPFIVGSFFRHKIHRWLEKWPDRATFVRFAGEGDWLHQFRSVILIRISPFPYIIFNYAAVATNVDYGPYISGSIVGTLHEIYITIYSGRLLQSLAYATNAGGFLSLEQIIYDIIGFSITAAATAAITIYANRTLQTLQTENNHS